MVKNEAVLHKMMGPDGYPIWVVNVDHEAVLYCLFVRHAYEYCHKHNLEIGDVIIDDDCLGL